MSLFGAFVVFIVVWWLVFFITLPIGVRPAERPEPGHEAGAPEQPRLWIKAAVATAVSLAITIGAYFAVEADLIGLRQLVVGP